jgi:hypothetical protein
VAAVFREQPLPHGQQLFGHRAKGANLFTTLPGFDDRQTGHHHVAMHIQPTAPLIDDFHGFLSFRKHFISNHERSKTSRGVSVLDQFHLHARIAISGGSAKHLGTSLESKLSRIKFTLVLSLPIFSLPVYPVFMPSGAPPAHDVFGMKGASPRGVVVV